MAYLIPASSLVANSESSAAANASVIRNALISHKHVVVPAGLYFITQVELMDTNDLTLEGDGYQHTLLVAPTGYSGNLLHFGKSAPTSKADRVSNISVKGLTLTCSGTGLNDNVIGLNLDSVHQGTVSDFATSRIGTGVRMYSVSTYYMERFYITDPSPNQGKAGIVVDGGNDQYFSSGILMTNTNGFCGLEILATGALWMRDCDVMNFVQGMRIVPTIDRQVDFLFFEAVAFDSGKESPSYKVNGIDTYGVFISNYSTALCHGISFDNCWFSTCSVGARITNGRLDNNGGIVDGVQFDNCKFFQNLKEGLLIEGGAKTKNIDIRNSQIAGNSDGTNATGVYSGIRTSDSVEGLRITDNSIGSSGAMLNKQKHAIELGGANLRNVTIVGNDVETNLASPRIQLANLHPAYRVVRSNLGYRTEWNGFGQIDVGQQVANIDHFLQGVAGAGDFVITITPTRPEVACGITGFWINSQTATQFQIAANTVVTGNAFTFQWTAQKV